MSNLKYIIYTVCLQDIIFDCQKILLLLKNDFSDDKRTEIFWPHENIWMMSDLKSMKLMAFEWKEM